MELLMAFVVVLGLLTGGQGHRHYDDDDFDPSEDIIPALYHAEEVSRRLLEALGVPEEQRKEILGENPPGTEATCAGCKAAYRTLKTTIENNELEDIYDVVLDVCIVTLSVVEGMRGDIMCPGIITYYGEAAWEIFRNPEILSMNEACVYFNLCDETTNTEKRKESRKTKRSALSPKLPPSLPPGTKRDLSTAIKVAHLADIHVEELYLEGSAVECSLPVCCRGDGDDNGGEAGHWGSFNCNIPPRTVEAMLGYLAEQNPDMVVYAGDSPPHTVWDETLESQLNVSRYVAESLARNLPGVPIYATVGNHETFPTSFIDPLNPLGKALLKGWGQAFGELGHFSQEQYDTLEDVGVFTLASTHPSLRILSYNTNYGYNANGYNLVTRDRDDYQRMKTFVENTLAAAKANNEKVILVGHHPTGMQSVITPYSRWIVNVQRQYADTIVLHLSGHHHDDEFRLITDPDSGRAVAAMHSGPTMGTKSTHNPAMRLIYLDPDTFLPLDMDVFYLDISKAIKTKAQEAPIEHEYRFTEEYGLEDMTVGSLEELACRMEQDKEVFDQYYRNMKAQSRDDCSGSCEHKRKCVTWHSDWYSKRDCETANEYEPNCRTSTSSSTTTSTTTTTTSPSTTTTVVTMGAQALLSWNILIVSFLGMFAHLAL